MSQDGFKKFINPKKNSVKKEEIRQEKKQERKEKRAYFEEKKKAEYAERQAKRGELPRGEGPEARGKWQETKGKGQGANIPSRSAGMSVEKTGSSQSTPSRRAGTSVGGTFDGQMPLNKFLAHCGISSRREAADIISKGNVFVNGKVVTEPGTKIQASDEVKYNGKKLFVTKNLVYILINKPKDYLTTTDDPEGRKTVMDLIKTATSERVYPIGRLDRNTSGVLLMTNDGDLTQKLSHPGYEITKIYEAKLDKPLTKNDFEKILSGLKLEDGQIFVDSLAYADAKDKSIIGLEIHSGRNRIVRRIFESLGYDVKALDRVSYAGLTKKNVERGRWRYLSEKEIRLLKYLNNSKTRKKIVIDEEALGIKKKLK